MKIQWYPGHMTKARRAMQEDIRLVDLVIEVLDARIPDSSRNPDIDTLAAGKFRLILLNKADLADPVVTEEWIRFFSEKGITALSLDSRSRASIRQVKQAIGIVCREKKERDRKRGILNRPVRAMVAGIPNVGKSTFINSFAGRAAAKTGNLPGVTRGDQWIRLDSETELLDTPGILWPRFEDDTVGMHLAMTGAIHDDVLDRAELAFEFVRFMIGICPGCFTERYAVSVPEDYDGTPDAVNTLIEEAGRKRNCLKKGGEVDTDKISGLIIDDFRTGKLGKISIERP